MAWSLGLRLRLYGECRIGGAPAQPATVELSLTRGAPGRFLVTGTLRSPELGERSIDGLWCWPDALELELGDGCSFVGILDPAAPRSLLGRSLWTGPLTQAGEPRGSLHLRFDLRHDWFSLLRSLHV